MSNLINLGLPESTTVDQEFGELRNRRIGLPALVRMKSVAALNRLLAHTMALRDLYKKARWQISGPTFYELHLLFERHHEAQLGIMDLLAERVQTIGGVAFALAHDVAEETRIARAPRGREAGVSQLTRLLDAHEIILLEARPLAREAAERADDGTNDLIVGTAVRTNEPQSWLLGEHLAARQSG